MNTESKPQRPVRRVAISRVLAASALAALAVLALPSMAAADGPWLSPTTVGLGTLDGKVTYDEAVPATGESCAARAFDLEATATSFAFNTVIVGHVGEIKLSGSGASECESASAGSGTISFRMVGNGPTGSKLRCPPPDSLEPLVGTYERTGAAMSISVAGHCWINNYRTTPVTIEATVGFAPTNPPAGVAAPMSEGDIDGAFNVALPEDSPLHPENMGDLVDRLGLG